MELFCCQTLEWKLPWALPPNLLTNEYSPSTFSAWSFHFCLDHPGDWESSSFLDSPFKFWTALIVSKFFTTYQNVPSHNFPPLLLAWLLEQCPRDLMFTRQHFWLRKSHFLVCVRNASLRTFHIQKSWKQTNSDKGWGLFLFTG